MKKTVEELRMELIGKEIDFASLDNKMEKFGYYSNMEDGYISEYKNEKHFLYIATDTNRSEVMINFEITTDANLGKKSENAFYLKVTSITSMCSNMGCYYFKERDGRAFKYDNMDIYQLQKRYSFLLETLVKKKGRKWCNNIFKYWYRSTECYKAEFIKTYRLYGSEYDTKMKRTYSPKKESLIDFVLRIFSELDYNHMEIDEESLLLAIKDAYRMAFAKNVEIEKIIKNESYEYNGIKHNLKIVYTHKRPGTKRPAVDINSYYLEIKHPSPKYKDVVLAAGRLYIGCEEFVDSEDSNGNGVMCISCEFIPLDMLDNLIDECIKRQWLNIYEEWREEKVKKCMEVGTEFTIDMLESKDIREDFAKFACYEKVPNFQEIWQFENYLMAPVEKGDYVQNGA